MPSPPLRVNLIMKRREMKEGASADALTVKHLIYCRRDASDVSVRRGIRNN